MHKLEIEIKNIHKHAQVDGSKCLVKSESLAADIFIQKQLRPDLYVTEMSNYHYHLRLKTPGVTIFDPTIHQFFNVDAQYIKKVFIGSEMELKKRLTELHQKYGFNDKHLYIKSTKPEAIDDIFNLWFKVKVSKAGSRLTLLPKVRPDRPSRACYS